MRISSISQTLKPISVNNNVKILNKPVQSDSISFSAKKGLSQKEMIKILNENGIECEVDKDGKFIVSKLTGLNSTKDWNAGSLDDVNQILGNIKIVKGDAYLKYPYRYCGIFTRNQYDYSNLEEIGGNALLDFCQYEYEFPKLKKIGGTLNIEDSPAKLDALEHAGSIYGRKAQIQSLPNLRQVDGNMIFRKSLLRDIPKLETVGGDLDLSLSSVSDISSIKQVGGDCDLSGLALQYSNWGKKIATGDN